MNVPVSSNLVDDQLPDHGQGGPASIPDFVAMMPISRTPTIHELKTWSDVFPGLLDGSKRFESRKYDRDFRVDDLLYLREWDRGGEGSYTGRSIALRVTYVLFGGRFGIEDGYVVMGLDGVRHAVETSVCRWLRSDRGDGHLSAFVEANCGVSFRIPTGAERDYKFCLACGKRTAWLGSSPEEPTEPQSSHVCRWTRLPDLTDPFESHKVRYRCGCNGEVVSGVHPIYPDDCPKCGKQVLPTPKLPEKAKACRCNRESALDCSGGTQSLVCPCRCHPENGKGDV